MRQADRSPLSSIRRSRVKLALYVFCLSMLVEAKVLDRIAIVVNRAVITESQVDEEVRVTLFLNREPVTEERQTKKLAADRLIQQLLVRHEMDLSQYPLPSTDQVSALLKELQQQFGGAQLFRRALASYGLTEAILSDHLRFQLIMLKFVDFRFRPDVEISESDIRSYYAEELSKWNQSHTTAAPGLEQSRASIEKTLSDQRVDYALSSWLEQARRDANVVFLDKELN